MVASMVFVFGLSAAAVVQPASAQDAPVLRGRVVADGVPAAPIRRARIIVTAGDAELPPVFTDEEGRFAVSVPRASSHALAITKAGFAPHDAAGIPSDGISDLPPIVLARGAVVSGRVVDPAGDPVVTEITLRRVDGVAMAGDATGLRVVYSDDRGEFRSGSLAAGRYEVYVERSALASLVPARGGGPAPPRPPIRPAAVVDVEAGDEVAVTLTRSMDPVAMLTDSLRRSVGLPDAVSSGGSSTIRGRVVSPGGRPIERARVRLMGRLSSRAFVQSGELAVALTDGNGMYRFDGLPGGAFSIEVSRTGYAPVIPSPPFRDDEAAIRLTGDARVETVDVVLQPLAAIEGRVVDEFGDPMEGLAMQVWRVQFVDGQVRVVPRAGRGFATDDRGRYRAHGLSAGTYYVVAAASPGSDPLAPEPPRVFYPGRLSFDEAAAVRIERGFDATGIDLTFDTTAPPLARVSGRVVDASGEPLQGTVILSARHRPGMAQPPARAAAIGDDGAFTIPNVAPGEYIVHAVQAGLLAFPRQSGRQPLTVAGPEALSVVVQAVPGSTITGRIVLEGDGSRSASDVRFTAVPADADAVPMPGPGAPAALSEARPWAVIMRDGGRFEMGGLTGPVRFVSERAPDGWWLKSVVVDGRNAVDEPVTFGTAQQSRADVQVVFSDAGGEITGRVLDGGQAPARDAAVIVFATDRRWWLHRSPRLRLARADADGHFTLSALPPGEYWVTAVGGVGEEGEWTHPDVLSRLAGSARRLTVGERERVELDVRLTMPGTL